MNAQVDADVRDALLDIASAQQQVEVARSSVDLANEALSEAQQRYAAGVSDNLAVQPGGTVRCAWPTINMCRAFTGTTSPSSAWRGRWARLRITRVTWEESERGGNNDNTSTNRAGYDNRGRTAAVPPQGHHHCCDCNSHRGRRRVLVALHIYRGHR